MAAIDEYFEALKRLKKNTPVRLPKGTTISKDTVAMEAGRKRSSIKRSRPVFDRLIAEIDLAVSNQDGSLHKRKDRFEKIKAEKQRYQLMYHQSLNRELMLVKRLTALERQLDSSKPITSNSNMLG